MFQEYKLISDITYAYTHQLPSGVALFGIAIKREFFMFLWLILPNPNVMLIYLFFANLFLERQNQIDFFAKMCLGWPSRMASTKSKESILAK